jgi:hydrogenase maturation protease
VAIGNDLVADDGAGPAVYDLLAAAPLPAGVRLLHMGLGGIALLDELEGEETLVVVDAVMLGDEPGTVHVIEWAELPEAGQAVTGHGIGVREAIAVGRRLFPERMPRRVFLVGIEGRRFDGLGEPLTPAVAAAIRPAAAAAMRLAVGGRAVGAPATPGPARPGGW